MARPWLLAAMTGGFSFIALVRVRRNWYFLIQR
jgi:hypothetical protein